MTKPLQTATFFCSNGFLMMIFSQQSTVRHSVLGHTGTGTIIFHACEFTSRPQCHSLSAFFYQFSLPQCISHVYEILLVMDVELKTDHHCNTIMCSAQIKENQSLVFTVTSVQLSVTIGVANEMELYCPRQQGDVIGRNYKRLKKNAGRWTEQRKFSSKSKAKAFAAYFEFLFGVVLCVVSHYSLGADCFYFL